MLIYALKTRSNVSLNTIGCSLVAYSASLFCILPQQSLLARNIRWLELLSDGRWLKQISLFNFDSIIGCAISAKAWYKSLSLGQRIEPGRTKFGGNLFMPLWLIRCFFGTSILIGSYGLNLPLNNSDFTSSTNSSFASEYMQERCGAIIKSDFKSDITLSIANSKSILSKNFLSIPNVDFSAILRLLVSRSCNREAINTFSY